MKSPVCMKLTENRIHANDIYTIKCKTAVWCKDCYAICSGAITDQINEIELRARVCGSSGKEPVVKCGRLDFQVVEVRKGRAG